MLSNFSRAFPFPFPYSHFIPLNTYWFRALGAVALIGSILAAAGFAQAGDAPMAGGAKDNVHYKVHIEDPKHPIVRGLADFQITNEVYAGHGLDPKVHVILTTDKPSNMKAIAWVHSCRHREGSRGSAWRADRLW